MDFDLLIEAADGTARATSRLSGSSSARNGSSWPASSILRFSSAPDEREAASAPAAGQESRPIESDPFFERLRQELAAALEAALPMSCGVRVRVRLEGAEEFDGLPWEEIIELAASRLGARSSDLSVVRYLPSDASTSLPKVFPLRALLALASPQGLPDLDGGGARYILRRDLGPLIERGDLSLEVLERASEEALRGGELGARHVFHFIGHGSSNPIARYGSLFLVGEDAAPRALTAHYLSSLLRERLSTRLVILSGGDANASLQSFGEAARILVRNGIPSVLVTDGQPSGDAAGVFFRELYRSLVSGAPVDVSVGAARRALASSALAPERAVAPALYASTVVSLCDPREVLLSSALDATAGDRETEERAGDARSLAAKAAEQKRARGEFDVFICYREEDKIAVRRICDRLEQSGLLPWMAEKESRPGLPWQELLERQIGHIRAAAVVIGRSGIGPWQQMEVDALLREFVRRRCPVIPVLLESAPARPQLPLFLRDFVWVDFRTARPNPLQQLIWGITGQQRP